MLIRPSVSPVASFTALSFLVSAAATRSIDQEKHSLIKLVSPDAQQKQKQKQQQRFEMSRTSYFTFNGCNPVFLDATHHVRRQQRADSLVDIRLVVYSFQHSHQVAPHSVVRERAVESALHGSLDDLVHAMLISAVRGVRPDHALFLARRIGLFASTAVVTAQGLFNYCILKVEIHVLEWLARRHAVLEQRWPSTPESELDGGGFGGVPASDEAIEAVQTTTYVPAPAGGGGRERTMDVRETTCVVCMEDFTAGQELRVMPCAHAFHKGCLDPWLKTSHVCPLCRFPIATEQDHAHVASTTLSRSI